jgi:hypothetical protein
MEAYPLTSKRNNDAGPSRLSRLRFEYSQPPYEGLVGFERLSDKPGLTLMGYENRLISARNQVQNLFFRQCHDFGKRLLHVFSETKQMLGF